MLRIGFFIAYFSFPIGLFAQHLSIQEQGEKFALFKDSVQITEYIFTEVADKRDVAIWVNKGDLYGYIDSNGREITEFIYDEVSGFYGGRARVARDSMYGFLDPSGKERVEVKYLAATLFKQGLASVEIDSGQWMLIDTVGDRIGKTAMDHPAHYRHRDFICYSSQGKWGVMNSKGEIIHPPKYDLITPDGTAWLNDKKYWLNLR